MSSGGHSKISRRLLVGKLLHQKTLGRTSSSAWSRVFASWLAAALLVLCLVVWWILPWQWRGWSCWEWVALEGFSFGPDGLDKSYHKCGEWKHIGFSEQAWHPFKWLNIGWLGIATGKCIAHLWTENNAIYTYTYIYIYSVSILQTSLVHS